MPKTDARLASLAKEVVKHLRLVYGPGVTACFSEKALRGLIAGECFWRGQTLDESGSLAAAQARGAALYCAVCVAMGVDPEMHQQGQ